MRQACKAWIVGLVLTVAVVWLSTLWLDRPIAFWVHDRFGEVFEQHRMTARLADTRILSLSFVATCWFIICGVFALTRRYFSRVEAIIALSAISMLATVVLKDELKVVFGRTWPASWQPGILSLVGNGAYGFHFFHSGKSFESFPSGHAAIAAAILSIPWLLVPNLRLICAICILAVDCGLVALNLHFLSDVIAGSFTGFSAGLFTVALSRAIGFPAKQ
jgi:membrane-associated phospholipid phosphatase